MKERRTGKKEDQLADFLNRAEHGGLRDDFEKEAASGYSGISREEAMRLKSSADKRFAANSRDRRSKLLNATGIAASVLLIVSLTVYFLRDTFVQTDKPMAQFSHAEKHEMLGAPGQDKTELSPQANPPSETMRAASAADNSAQVPVTPEAPAENKKAEPPASAKEITLASEQGVQKQAAPIVQDEKLQSGAEAEIAAPQANPAMQRKKSADAEAGAARAFATSAAPTDSAVWYITRELDENDETSKKEFTANIRISATGEIQKIDFVGKHDLSRKEIKTINDFLLGRESAYLRNINGGNAERTVRLRYKP